MPIHNQSTVTISVLILKSVLSVQICTRDPDINRKKWSVERSTTEERARCSNEIISRRDRAALAETAVGKGRVVPGIGSINSD